MKKQTLALLIFTVALTCSVRAQFGQTPSINGSIEKLFGDNTAFSADVEFQTVYSPGQTTTTPGKIAYDSGKTRFEVDFSEVKGQTTPGMAQHMKQMGMSKTVVISRPDTKTSYFVYPDINAYAETPLQNPAAAEADKAPKIDTSELGRESLDGHECIKNKVVVTDDKGKTHEFTTWNATDLKKFPIKIETVDQPRATTMLFKNVKTSKPDAALFEAPADFKKYTSQRELMQQEMMKHMPGMNMPPGHP